MKKLIMVLSGLIFLSGCGGGKPAAPVISVSVAPSAQTKIDQGQSLSYTATVSNDSSSMGVTWSMAGTGCTGAACGTFTNTTTSAVTYNAPASVSANMTVTILATSGADATKSMSSTVIVAPAPGITTTSLAGGTVATAYSATLQASGGAGPLTWSLVSGSSLPAGLSLSNAGAITGTPTTPATSNFTVKVTDSSGVGALTDTKQLGITIDPAPLAITTTALSNGVVGTAYSATLQSTGGTGTISWSVTTGNLPAGLTLSTAGAISGTPTAAATSDFTVTATDSGAPAQTVNQALSITTNPQVSITTTSLPNGIVSTAYAATVHTTGGVGSITWSVTTGSLPAGLTLSTAGAISGTPTAAVDSTFTVTAKDSGTPQQTVNKSLSITVFTGLTIVTTSLPNGTVSSAYAATLQSGGGTGTVNWSVTTGSLPAGLSLSNAGAISGTPTAAGTTNFTVTATDSGTPQQTKTQALSITINAALSISTTTLPGGTVGTAYNQSIQTNGGTLPVGWSVTTGSLPSGLVLQGTSAGAGTITGTPTANGTFNFTVTASDASSPQQTVQQALSIVINNAPLAIITNSLAGAVLTTAYNKTLQSSGGTPPNTWSVTVGSLPAGLTLSTSGTISGTPTAIGTSNFTVKVTDSTLPTHQTMTQALSIVVGASACGTGNEAILNGHYAFSLSGFNATGYLGEVGSFTADGSGHITAGEVDTNGTLGVQHANITTASSTYSVGSDNRGCATIATSFGTFTTRFALGSISSGKSTEGRIIEWETGSSAYIASGHILQQTTPFSSPSGNFVFAQSGADNSGDRFAATGVVSLGSGSITTGEMDMNNAGTVAHTAGVTGTYTSPNSNGRSTMTMTWTGDSSAHHAVFYLVSSSQAMFLPTDVGSAFVGEIRQQSGTFTNSSVNGKEVVYMSGLNGGGTGGSASIGLISANGSGSLTLSSYYDGGGTWNTPTPSTFTASYSVASNGRMVLTSGGSPVGFTYLIGSNKGIIMTADTDVAIGQMEAQVGSNFTTSSISGNFYTGTLEIVNQGAEASAGVATLNGSGGISGTSDSTTTTYQNGDETGGAGTMTVHSDGTFSTSDHPGIVIGIIISTTKAVIINNQGSTYPTIQVIKQ